MKNKTIDHNRFPGIPVDPIRTGHATTPTKVLFYTPNKIEYKVGRSQVYFCIFMCILAVVVWFLPFDIRTSTPLNLMQCISVGLVWGGICSLIPYFLIKRFGTRLIFDLNRRKIYVFKSNQIIQEFSIIDLQCLQICYAKYDRFQSYELNLCFSGMDRFNMLSSNTKRSAFKLAQQLAEFLNKEVLDCTEENKKR